MSNYSYFIFMSIRFFYNVCRLLVASVGVIRDPRKLDRVIEIADRLRTPTVMAPVLERLNRDPVTRAALASRRRLAELDLTRLGRLPSDTFGRAYADYLRANGLNPADLPKRLVASDSDYVSAHFYETHDLWHVATGFGTDVAGELGLQAFYLGQGPYLFAAFLIVLGLLNTMFFAWDDCQKRFAQIVRGWLLGTKATPLFGVPWDELWETPLRSVRHELKIDLSGVTPERFGIYVEDSV